MVLQIWHGIQRADFVYATVSLVIAGMVAFALIGGFVYLVIQGHPKAAGALLGSGALSLVTGFLTMRLSGRVREK
jgi:hypothetical protein